MIRTINYFLSSDKSVKNKTEKVMQQKIKKNPLLESLCYVIFIEGTTQFHQ
jgi:hypothetical protein